MLSTLLPILLAAAGEDRLAVLAVADPPSPEPELVELTHQLRAACRDRSPGVLELPEMRARLLGQASGATLAELERAYAGAIATYQHGEYEGAARTLRAVIEDLERQPETPEAHAQWLRATLRLAHVELTLGRQAPYRELLERVAAIEPRHAPDPDQFSPTFRRDLDAARGRVAARRRHRLAVAAAGGWSATVFVNGKAIGPAPATIQLPPGRYRVGGAAGALRVPTVWVELGKEEERSVVLDFPLAEALRVSAGPGLALTARARPAALVRTGAWLGADRVLAASIAAEERGVQLFVGTLFDVRRGAVLREGRVRMAAGAAPASSVAALAAFLLTGQPSQEVVNSTPAAQEAAATPASGAPEHGPSALSVAFPEEARSRRAATATATPTSTGTGTGTKTATPTSTGTGTGTPTAIPTATATGTPTPGALDLRPRPSELPPPLPASRPRWMKPAAAASALLALGLGSYAAQQGLSSRGAYGDATALLRAEGGAQDARYHSLVAAGDRARRNAWVGAAGTAAFAAAAGLLGYLSFTEPVAPAVRF